MQVLSMIEIDPKLRGVQSLSGSNLAPLKYSQLFILLYLVFFVSPS